MKLVYGRAGTGKSFYCMNEIKNYIENNSNKILIYIVPEQYSLSAEFELSKMLNKNGTINIQVLSFKRLAYRVFNELGYTKNTFSKSSKSMLIYHIMLKEEKNLMLLKGVEKNRGLTDTVVEMISEFKRYNVTVDLLKNIKTDNEYLKMKLHDLALIYEKFEERVSKNYIDEDSRLTMLTSLISKSNMLKNAVVWIDEFDNFTLQELEIIKELEKASNVTVTLTLDKDSELFALNQKVFNRLSDIGASEYVRLEIEHRYANNELKHFEENIFKYPYIKCNDNTTNIHVNIDSSLYSEIDNIAKIISKKVREENLRYENIAILTRNINSYKTIFSRVFNDYNIPYFFDDKKELSMQPLLTLVSSLFDIISKNFRYENVFNYLKTGFTNIQDINDIDILENYVLKYGIRGSKWLEEWTYPDDNLEKINLIREKVVTPIINLKEDLSNKKKAKDISNKLYNFLLEIGVYETLQNKINLMIAKDDVSSLELENANVYIQVWNIFVSLLDELVDSLGNEVMSFDTYKNVLTEGISTHQIGILPTSNDLVLIGDISRTRNSNVKVLFVIGVNDGVFPMPFSSEGFINDNERDLLLEQGIELAKNTKLLLLEENFNIYKALTTPSDELYISYPIADQSGNALRPSSIINQIKNIFPNIDIKSNILNKNEDIYTSDSTFSPMLSNIRNYYDGKEIEDKWENAYLWYLNNQKDRLLKAQNGLDYKNTIEYLDNNHSKKLYGSEIYTSVSRLETYTNCPFSFFLRYGLKIKDRKVFRLDTPDIGIFLHDIIDKFSEYIMENNISIREIEKDEADKIVLKLVNDSLKDFKYNIFTSSAQMKKLSLKLQRVIKRIIWIIVNHIKNGEFEISGSEVEFGKNKKLGAVTIELSDGSKLVLNGKIDRIDIAKNGDNKYIRIIDYKSYNKELKLSDIYYGLQLQLLVYLDAAMEEELIPGGMLYLKLDDPIVKTKKQVPINEVEDEINKRLRMKGVILSDARLLKAMDSNMVNESSVLELSIKKDGTYSSKVPAATKEQFNDLRRHMKNILKQMGDEILSGNIKNEPVKKKGHTPCEYCDYKLICRFDKELGNKFRLINELKNEEVFDKIKED